LKFARLARALIFAQENYTPYIKEWREYITTTPTIQEFETKKMYVGAIAKTYLNKRNEEDSKSINR
jgi:hypothetical protein